MLPPVMVWSAGPLAKDVGLRAELSLCQIRLVPSFDDLPPMIFLTPERAAPPGPLELDALETTA